MKNIFSFVAICFTCCASYAQPVIQLTPCTDERLRFQADSIKKVMEQSGYISVKEHSVSMESEYELPVIAPLTKNTWYHIVFIGNEDSRLYEMRMYDWEESMVAYHKQLQKDVNGNIIQFRYIPYQTGYFMMKALQVNKNRKKGLCGYMMIMKKVS